MDSQAPANVLVETMETGTRLRELRALGVPKWAASKMANSRRGAWEMSRNTNNALPNSYWEAKGLKNLLTRYLELC